MGEKIKSVTQFILLLILGVTLFSGFLQDPAMREPFDPPVGSAYYAIPPTPMSIAITPLVAASTEHQSPQAMLPVAGATGALWAATALILLGGAALVLGLCGFT